MSEYTVGEWEYAEETGLVHVGNNVIAKVYRAGRINSGYTGEGAANARLIQAAPRMYRLLEFIKHEVHDWSFTPVFEPLTLRLLSYIDGKEEL